METNNDIVEQSGDKKRRDICERILMVDHLGQLALKEDNTKNKNKYLRLQMMLLKGTMEIFPDIQTLEQLTSDKAHYNELESSPTQEAVKRCYGILKKFSKLKDGIESEDTKLKEELVVARSTIDDTNNKLEEVRQQLAAAQENIVVLKEEAREGDDRLQAQIEENEEMRQQLDVARDEKEEMQQQLVAFRDENEAMQQQLDEDEQEEEEDVDLGVPDGHDQDRQRLFETSRDCGVCLSMGRVRKRKDEPRQPNHLFTSKCGCRHEDCAERPVCEQCWVDYGHDGWS